MMNHTASTGQPPGEAAPFFPDKPLMLPQQDRLGRAEFAKFLAKAILGADIEQGFVLALYGAWGSGKSSTLNFVMHYVRELSLDEETPFIVMFNPWWFSGRQQLLEQFFRQLRTSVGASDTAARLQRQGDRIAAAGKVVEGVGKVPVPVAKDIIGPIGELIRSYGEGVSRVGKGMEVDVSGERRKLEDSLRELDRRILIFIDDVDRLPHQEVRDVFRLIKAVADFPKTIYLLAFDRDIVVSALADEQSSGAPYLDKIVQAGFDLPLPERVDLRQLLEEQLRQVLSGTPSALWDEMYWYNVYLEGVDYFIRTPRDIKRYLNTLRPSYSVVRGEVNAADFLAIEAVRVFAPRAYDAVRQQPELFVGSTGRGAWIGDRLDAAAKQSFAAVLDEVGNESHRKAVAAILKRLFPRYAQAFGGPIYSAERAGKWRKECRICSPDVFPVYFRLCVPAGALSKAEMDTLMSLADDPGALTAQLRRLASERAGAGRRSRAGQFLDYLPDYTREDIPEGQIEGLVRSLHDAGDDLVRADDMPGPYEVRSEIQVLIITHQLLRRISDDLGRSKLLGDVFRTAASIPLIVHQLRALGKQHGKYGGLTADVPQEDRLLDAEGVSELEQIVRKRIEDAAASGALRAIPQLGYVLYFWQALAGDEPAREYVDGLTTSDEGVATLLEGLLAKSYTQVLTDPVGQTHYYIEIPGVARLVDPDKLRPAAERVIAEDPAWLTQPQRVALEVFLRDLKNKPEGYGPLETPN
jgi:predicted KAP-like P-loop ATPase